MTDKITVPHLHITEDGSVADTYIEHLFSDIFNWQIDDITRTNLPIMASAVLHQPDLMEAPGVFDEVVAAIEYTLKIAFITIWELDEKSKSVLPCSVQQIEPAFAAKLGDLKAGQPVVGRTVHQVVLLALIQYIREAANKQINSDVKH